MLAGIVLEPAAEANDHQVAGLHRKGRRVLCYFSAGSGENYRDDYDGFLQRWQPGDPATYLGEMWVA